MNLDLQWTPSPHYRRLMTVAVVATIASVVSGRAQLMLLAAPPLLVLLIATRPRPRTDQLTVVATLTPDRCLEGDQVQLDVDAHCDPIAGQLSMAITPIRPLRSIGPRRPAAAIRTGCLHANWTLSVGRWGRWTTASLTIVVRDQGRLWQATTRSSVGEVIAYPQPAAVEHLVIPRTLPARLGTHPSRSVGSGVEFAGIRAYQPGDSLRDVHWPASLRHDSLYVTTRAAERSADVIVAVDAFSDIAGSLERSVRGATGVARAYLRAGDRVGLVILGGGLRWLPPGTGQQTFYRISDAVLGVRRDDSVVSPSLDRIPSTTLPQSAMIVLFSPLLDDRAIATVQDLRDRGTAAIVVDVLTAEPSSARHPSSFDQIVLRLWRLDRAALRYRLNEAGVPVMHWDGRRALDEVLAPVQQSHLTGAPR